MQLGDISLIFSDHGQGGDVVHAGGQLARDEKEPAEQSENEQGEGRDERKREADGLGNSGVVATQRLEVALDAGQGLAASCQLTVD